MSHGVFKLGEDAPYIDGATATITPQERFTEFNYVGDPTSETFLFGAFKIPETARAELNGAVGRFLVGVQDATMAASSSMRAYLESVAKLPDGKQRYEYVTTADPKRLIAAIRTHLGTLLNDVIVLLPAQDKNRILTTAAGLQEDAAQPSGIVDAHARKTIAAIGAIPLDAVENLIGRVVEDIGIRAQLSFPSCNLNFTPSAANVPVPPSETDGPRLVTDIEYSTLDPNNLMLLFRRQLQGYLIHLVFHAYEPARKAMFARMEKYRETHPRPRTAIEGPQDRTGEAASTF